MVHGYIRFRYIHITVHIWYIYIYIKYIHIIHAWSIAPIDLRCRPGKLWQKQPLWPGCIDIVQLCVCVELLRSERDQQDGGGMHFHHPLSSLYQNVQGISYQGKSHLMTEGSLHWMAVCTMQQNADVDLRWSRFRLPARGSSSRRSYDEPRVQPPNREASLRFLSGCCRVNSGHFYGRSVKRSNPNSLIWDDLGIFGPFDVGHWE